MVRTTTPWTAAGGETNDWRRPHSVASRWPPYAVAGTTFPGTRPSLEDVDAQGARLDNQREYFDELHPQLNAEGWRPAAHWWSASYRRPDLKPTLSR